MWLVEVSNVSFFVKGCVFNGVTVMTGVWTSGSCVHGVGSHCDWASVSTGVSVGSVVFYFWLEL